MALQISRPGSYLSDLQILETKALDEGKETEDTRQLPVRNDHDPDICQCKNDDRGNGQNDGCILLDKPHVLGIIGCWFPQDGMNKKHGTKQHHHKIQDTREFSQEGEEVLGPHIEG